MFKKLKFLILAMAVFYTAQARATQPQSITEINETFAIRGLYDKTLRTINDVKNNVESKNFNFRVLRENYYKELDALSEQILKQSNFEKRGLDKTETESKKNEEMIEEIILQNKSNKSQKCNFCCFSTNYSKPFSKYLNENKVLKLKTRSHEKQIEHLDKLENYIIYTKKTWDDFKASDPSIIKHIENQAHETLKFYNAFIDEQDILDDK